MFDNLSTTLDLYTLFSTLRHAKPAKTSQHLPNSLRNQLDDLIQPIPQPLQTATLQTHDRLEKLFAKKSRRKLDPSTPTTSTPKPSHPEPAEHDAPIGDSSDSDSASADHNNDDEEDEDGAPEIAGGAGSGKDARKASVLLAEQNLCEFTGKLVLAVIAGVVVDSETEKKVRVKERLCRNRTRLGANYREVLAYLEDGREKLLGKKGGAGARKGAVQGKGRGRDGKAVEREEMGKEKARKSEAMVLEEDDIQDEELENEDGAADGGRGEEHLGGARGLEGQGEQDEEEEEEEEGGEEEEQKGAGDGTGSVQMEDEAEAEAEDVESVMGD